MKNSRQRNLGRILFRFIPGRRNARDSCLKHPACNENNPPQRALPRHAVPRHANEAGSRHSLDKPRENSKIWRRCREYPFHRTSSIDDDDIQAKSWVEDAIPPKPTTLLTATVRPSYRPTMPPLIPLPLVFPKLGSPTFYRPGKPSKYWERRPLASS